MARDADALRIRKWASGSTLVETPEAAGLTRSVGFPAAYGVDTARTLETWQQQMREVTAAFWELARGGILEWSADQHYPHDPVSVVTGSDGNIYLTVQASGGNLPHEDPVGDTENACWRPFVVTVPESTTTQRGIIEQATDAEAAAGVDDERAVNPEQVAAAIAAAPRPLWL